MTQFANLGFTWQIQFPKLNLASVWLASLSTKGATICKQKKADRWIKALHSNRQLKISFSTISKLLPPNRFPRISTATSTKRHNLPSIYLQCARTHRATERRCNKFVCLKCGLIVWLPKNYPPYHGRVSNKRYNNRQPSSTHHFLSNAGRGVGSRNRCRNTKLRNSFWAIRCGRKGKQKGTTSGAVCHFPHFPHSACRSKFTVGETAEKLLLYRLGAECGKRRARVGALFGKFMYSWILTTEIGSLLLAVCCSCCICSRYMPTSREPGEIRTGRVTCWLCIGSICF